MKTLSFLSAIFGIISFVLDMYEVFPHYQDTFEKLTFVLLGVFLGSAIAYFNKNQVKITNLTSAQSFVYLIFIAIGIGFIIVLRTIVITENKDKISALQSVLLCMAIFTFICMNALGSAVSVDHDPTSLDEKLLLAKHYEAKKMYGKSVYFYTKAFESLQEGDERKNSIQAKLERLKLEQVADQSHEFD